MHVLDERIQSSKRNPAGLLFGMMLASLVFIAMALTQLNIEYPKPEELAPLMEFHLPPPPPPPKKETPPQKTKVSINFDLPVTSGPADVPLGFLDVDFGLQPKKLTETQMNVEDSIKSFKTDGLADLEVYDYDEVTDLPRMVYRPPLEISRKMMSGSSKPFTFIVLYRVTERGRVMNVHIIDCPHPEAIETIKDFCQTTQYKPAKVDGKKVSVLIRRHITYNPSSGKSPFDI